LHKRNLIFAILMLMLMLGVAGREIPECASLADDVSNDGEVVSYVQEKTLDVCVGRVLVPAANVHHVISSLHWSNARPLPTLGVQTSDKAFSDLLRLICLQRT
jgi:hypothetical protein